MQHAFEALLLPGGEPIICSGWGIGTGQVGVEAGQLHGVQFANGGHQPGAFWPVSPQPGHAGVELQLQLHGPALAAGQVLADQGFAHAADGGHQLPAQAAAQFFDLGQVAQHQDRRFDTGPAQFDALSQGGNTALAGSAGEGGPGHRHRAVAVAIGFHHGHQAGCWADPALEAAGIGTYCSGVHLHPGPLTGQAGFSGFSAPAGLGGLGHGLKARLRLACRLTRVLAWAKFSF